ncbi:hypothetical protein NN561_007036 [Cricetulus griseus]
MWSVNKQLHHWLQPGPLPAPIAAADFTEEEELLSRRMMTYWTNFARHGCLQDITAMNMQALKLLKMTLPPIPMSEDCLYLNIYTPDHAHEGSNLPVMVWIHGGALVIGMASLYDGSMLAAMEDVVVVTIQYRLGILGFFSTGDQHARGNWGYLDQVAALRWVQQNIAHFGGNPDRVTIFGESAGGTSVSSHVVSPMSKGLFHGAIMESGVALMSSLISKSSEVVYRVVANLSGCEQVDSEALVNCLRDKSEEEIMAINKAFKIIPGIVDGIFLPRHPKELLASADFQFVPSIIGVNNDEYGWIIPSMWPPEFSDLLMEEYMGNNEDPQLLQGQFKEMMEDFMFVIPALQVAHFQRFHAPVYFYEFQHRPNFFKDSKPSDVKADHGDEILFIFRSFWGGTQVDLTEEEELLSRMMMKYWANFARHGNPNSKGLPTWPMFDHDEQYLQLDIQPAVGRALKARRLQFWTKTLPQKIQELKEAVPEKKKKFPAVPETLKKKRRNFAELKVKRFRKKLCTEDTAEGTARRKLIYEKAKHYHKEYRQMYRTEIRMARMARKAGNFYVPAEPKLAFVIRIRGINGVSPKLPKVLKLLRLSQIFNGTFVKLNKASINMLRIVEPYIAWGYPNLKSVNELIYKRGYGKINKKRIALTDNSLIAQSLGQDSARPIRTTHTGQVQGSLVHVKGTDVGVHTFLGIPFAKPPLGLLRFAPPEPPEPWSGVRDGTSHPAMCLQKADKINGLVMALLNLTPPSISMSEDCLYLSIYSPAHAHEGSSLPVMVWIHGGALVVGMASLYDGSILAATEDVVVVTIQYRLGVLGFFSTGDQHARGNWGYLDQVAALRWVQQNIAHFGGNPDRVTIFGESAGATSVSSHVVSPMSQGLFHGAIMESGVALMPDLISNTSEVMYKIVANLSRCEQVDSESLVNCLRGKSEEEILAINKVRPNGHGTIHGVVDGDFLPRHPQELLASVDFQPVTSIIGVNNDEFGWLLSTVRSSSMSSSLGSPGRMHRPNFFKDIKPPHVKADHADELPFVFGSFCGNKIDLTEEEEMLNKMMMKYWANFARNGTQSNHNPALLGGHVNRNPNGDGLFYWPVFDQEQQYLQLDLQPGMGRALKDHRFQFWTKTLPQKIQELKRANVTHPEVDTPLGRVRGRQVGVKGTDHLVNVFLGIPFAQAPLGPLRFSAPLPPQPWEGVRDARTNPPMCLQDVERMSNGRFTLNEKLQIYSISEDCLILNIYSPTETTAGARLPVMVWIHGGSLVVGSATSHDGSALAAYGDVVVVTVQYRLGIFGFLSTGDKHMPGNRGLLDVVAALRWVQGNIAPFGGDPNCVTIFGNSVGGMIVSSLTFANSLACSSVSSEELVQCLLQKEGKDLNKQNNVNISYITNDSFFPQSPEKLLTEKQFPTVPYLLGVNNHEFGWLMLKVWNMLDKLEHLSQEDLLEISRPFLALMDMPPEIMSTVIDEYLDNGSDPPATRYAFQELLSDIVFVIPTLNFSRHLQDAGCPVFLYEFQHTPSSFAKFKPAWVKADHGSESPFIFGGPFLTDESNLLGALHTSEPLVVTKHGILQGKQTHVGNITIQVFLGVPFSKPPVGARRFAPPDPPQPWNGIRDATTYPPSQTQTLETFLAQVMVWFPGGAFLVGSASTYEGSELAAREKVVLVFLQYRLGILGFLSTGDSQARGNWGLLDQIAALHWVQENIEAFGGNPDSVTLFGQSAGAMSISGLLMSPLAQGLFHRAISQSGTAILKAFITPDPLKAAKKVAHMAGCNHNNTRIMVECLRTLSGDEVMHVSKRMAFFHANFQKDPKDIIWFLSPVVDGVVFPEDPVVLLTRGQVTPVPYLLGVNNVEFEWTLPFNITKEQVPLVIKEYMNDAADKLDWKTVRNRLIDLVGDATFVYSTLQAAHYHRDAGFPVYLYEFKHHAPTHVIVKPRHDGADHGDELSYIFGSPFSKGSSTGEEKEFSLRMMKYWANFARTGISQPSRLGKGQLVQGCRYSTVQLPLTPPHIPGSRYATRSGSQPSLHTTDSASCLGAPTGCAVGPHANCNDRSRGWLLSKAQADSRAPRPGTRSSWWQDKRFGPAVRTPGPPNRMCLRPAAARKLDNTTEILELSVRRLVSDSEF